MFLLHCLLLDADDVDDDDDDDDDDDVSGAESVSYKEMESEDSWTVNFREH